MSAAQTPCMYSSLAWTSACYHRDTIRDIVGNTRHDSGENITPPPSQLVESQIGAASIKHTSYAGMPQVQQRWATNRAPDTEQSTYPTHRGALQRNMAMCEKLPILLRPQRGRLIPCSRASLNMLFFRENLTSTFSALDACAFRGGCPCISQQTRYFRYPCWIIIKDSLRFWSAPLERLGLHQPLRYMFYTSRNIHTPDSILNERDERDTLYVCLSRRQACHCNTTTLIIRLILRNGTSTRSGQEIHTTVST